MSGTVEVLAPTPQRLVALAEIVETEHGFAQDLARQALEHVIKAGEALAEARGLTSPGEWTRWCEARGLGERRARDYIRIATYRAEIPEWATTRTEAIVALKGLPPAGADGAGWQRISDDTREEAMRLREEGLTQRQVAKALGISHVTIGLWERGRGDIEAQRRARELRKRREREQRRALQREKRDRAMRKHGGGVAEAYSLIRKALQTVDRCRGESEDAEMLHHLDQAIYGLHRAEEQVAKAVKIK